MSSLTEKLFSLMPANRKDSGVSDGLSELPLQSYENHFELLDLETGIDNIRYDVLLSPNFISASEKLIFSVAAKYCQIEEIIDSDSNHVEKKTDFNHLLNQIFLEGVNKAKSKQNLHIDFLLQTAVAKMLKDKLQQQFDKILNHINDTVREFEITDQQDEAIRFKKKLQTILSNKNAYCIHIGKEIFDSFIEVYQKDIKQMRALNFGKKVLMPDHFFFNPMLFADDPHDEHFILEEYHILLGKRVEDPDKYEAILSMLQKVLNPTHMLNVVEDHFDELDENANNPTPNRNDVIDGHLKISENIDIIFNTFHTIHQCREVRKKAEAQDSLTVLRRQAKIQSRFLNRLYHVFKKNGLVRRITATYEMLPVYQRYCPPLVPQLIMHYIISPKTRRSVEARLKRLSKFYGNAYDLEPLKKIIRNIRRLKAQVNKAYLIRFLKNFVLYHRDYVNYCLLKDAMDSVNLLNEEKLIRLSKTNNTLYEFLLPHERKTEEKPIINHVIIKADVRGSTDITYQMTQQKLNPASFFSMNLFDPITEILPEYGAEKVFVEGDAIILSIFEREESPENWYSVARACGLAVNILFIIKRYNSRSRKYNLPVIELGIGICFQNSKPTFLFDGDNRIMISTSINLADRMSSCSKSIKKFFSDNAFPFNLYVFHSNHHVEQPETFDDFALRYNVNGIELSPEAFEKLAEEIDLTLVELDIPTIKEEKSRFHTGKFPTVAGNFKRLIIREANIPKVDPIHMTIFGTSHFRYYEVCTNPKIYEAIRQHQ